ncbi:MAG: hypothetical protein M1833_005977 [Piccolia ochrophora]|nr:MAG: hypothetical protein M1833_005977 [Piccolia ochrophora]
MADQRSSSGVRNLRARFEAKEGDSPPSRGRSPAASEDKTSNGSNTPRRLSTARTSFVAVERSGGLGSQLGLKKSNETESVAEKRRDSFSMSDSKDSQALGDVKETIEDELDKRKKSAVVETVPEVAVENAGGKTDSARGDDKKARTASPQRRNSPAAEDTPTSNPDKPVSATEDKDAVLLPADPKEETTITGSISRPGERGRLGQMEQGNPKPQSPPSQTTKPVSQTSSAGKPKPSSIHEANGEKNSNPTMDTPSSKSMQAKDLPSSPQKAPFQASSAGEPNRTSAAPVAAEPPTTPSKDTRPSTSGSPSTMKVSPLKEATEPATPREVRPITIAPEIKDAATERRGKSATKPSPTAKTSPTTKTSAAIKRSPTAERRAASSAKTSPTEKPSYVSPFKKPKPRSPTRPVQLPLTFTAQTASSAAKNSGGNVPFSSTKSNAADGTSRRQSSVPTRQRPNGAKTSNPTTSSLRKPSPRQSLPPNHAAEPPRSRVSSAGSKAPDQGFLARMMRPTTSSAQKTHEKPNAKPGPASKHAKSGKPQARSRGSDGISVHSEGHSNDKGVGILQPPTKRAAALDGTAESEGPLSTTESQNASQQQASQVEGNVEKDTNGVIVTSSGS